MKKIYLSLLGAMMALTASAQQQLLSSYTLDPVTNEKTWQCDYTYENGKLTEIHSTYYYAEGNTEYKTLYIYDDQGRLLRYEYYTKRDGEFVMTYKEESEGQEWNEDGLPTTVIIYEEKNPGQLLPAWKEFIHGYLDLDAVDKDEYISDGAGGWTYYATYTAEYNSKGEFVKQYREIYWEDVVYKTTLLNEYDDHSRITKLTYTCDIDGNWEYIYENFYDANGVIEKRNVYLDGSFLEIQYYVWGDPNAVQGVKASAGAANGWFDLNGRRINGQPTKKGLYIRDGKKIVLK